jgi:transposase
VEVSQLNISFLLPGKGQLQLDCLELSADQLTILVSSTTETAACPKCQMLSERVNGHYHRRPADLPCGGYHVRLDWRVRRFFCDNPMCPRQTFGERFPTIVKQYARRTNRLATQQQRIAFEVGGKVGERVSAIVQAPTSRDTHLRLIRQTPEPALETPRILGIDDWAKRKGHHYGTILVDLEKRQPVDLLPDRTADLLAEWLAEHPGVEIITRDRSGEYAQGATRGAPEAIQVADRFHLLQNLTEVLKRMFDSTPKKLREIDHLAAEETTVKETAVENVALLLEDNPSPAVTTNITPSKSENDRAFEAVCIEQTQTMAQLRFAEVKALQKQGLSKRDVSKQAGVSRRTVRRYWPLDEYPEKQHGYQSVSTVLPFHAYVVEHWQTTCQNRQQLFLALQAQGYSGSYPSVWRYVGRLVRKGELTAETPRTGRKKSTPAPRPLSARKAAWCLAARPEDLDPEESKLRELLCRSSTRIAEAYSLAQDFGKLIRERQAEKFDAWLHRAEESIIVEFRHFATGLRRDYRAVKAALIYEWNQGQVEGQVNRLKFIKRQGYGRANFDLLRKRVLGFPQPP